MAKRKPKPKKKPNRCNKCEKIVGCDICGKNDFSDRMMEFKIDSDVANSCIRLGRRDPCGLVHEACIKAKHLPRWFQFHLAEVHETYQEIIFAFPRKALRKIAQTNFAEGTWEALAKSVEEAPLGAGGNLTALSGCYRSLRRHVLGRAE